MSSAHAGVPTKFEKLLAVNTAMKAENKESK
jgi:hypothetical protein